MRELEGGGRAKGETPFSALVAHLREDGTTRLAVEKKTVSSLYMPPRYHPLPAVTIRVHYSSLNYKDALSASGNHGVTRSYPHTPGIDAAGIVTSSEDARFEAGQKVIVTGYDLGSNTSGGFGGMIRVPGDWVVPLPAELTLRDAMILGTAGFTAAYGVKKLLDNGLMPMHPGQDKPHGGMAGNSQTGNSQTGNSQTSGSHTNNYQTSTHKKAAKPSSPEAENEPLPVLVTGATGGVGSVAVGILHRLGFRVIAVTGKPEAHDYLLSIGADEVHDRSFVMDVDTSRLLLSGRWAGGIDTVGGKLLEAMILQTAQAGVIACCGNVTGHELHTNIYPFILRGVGLMGIDSAQCTMQIRRDLWSHLATDWRPAHLTNIKAREVGLHGLAKEIDTILKGQQTGRVLVTHDGADLDSKGIL